MWNIQLEDLRIGNIIKWGHWPSIFGADDYMNVYVNGAEFNGIKLTDELLDLFSNKVDRTRFSYSYLSELGLYSVDITNEDGVFSCTKICQYIHELQNFFHGVTGQDLQYNEEQVKEFLNESKSDN